MSDVCAICGRKLTNPKSIEIGVGPECRMKGKKDTIKRLCLFPRSEYSIAIKDGILMIMDEGGPKSVTNDIEEILKDIEDKVDLSKFKIIYRDSMGVWDGITEGPAFYAIYEKDLNVALSKKLKNYKGIK